MIRRNIFRRGGSAHLKLLECTIFLRRHFNDHAACRGGSDLLHSWAGALASALSGRHACNGDKGYRQEGRFDMRRVEGGSAAFYSRAFLGFCGGRLPKVPPARLASSKFKSQARESNIGYSGRGGVKIHNFDMLSSSKSLSLGRADLRRSEKRSTRPPR